MIAKVVRKQIREVHDFFADVIRRGQEAGGIYPDREPEPPRRGSSSPAACSARSTTGSAG